MADVQQATTPRQVKLKQCRIYSPAFAGRQKPGMPSPEQGVDITSYVLSIDLYESLFDNTISGQIEIRDTSALPEFLPLVGIEVIFIEFSINYLGEEVIFTRAFRLRRLADQTFPKNEERSYTLELVTQEFIESLSSRIIKTYTNEVCSNAIYDIMKTRLKIPDSDIRMLEPTDGNVTVTIPNYTPLQVINFLTNLSLTRKRPSESNFVFFQTLEGFHFVSLQTLLQGPVVASYEVNANKVTGASQISEKDAYNTIIALQQEQSFDLAYDISTGVLRSKMLHIDFFARKWNEEDSRYTETFKQTTHLDKYPFYPENFDQSVSRNVKIFIVPSNISTANSKYIASVGDVPSQQRLYEAIVLRNRQMREILHLRTILDVPGQPGLRAGSIINLNYPSSRDLQDVSNNPAATPPTGPTPYYSGKHLVTSVRHKLSRTGQATMEYRMHLEAVRDSFGSPLTKFAEIANDVDGKAV